MARRICAQNLNCLEMGAQKHRKCPNSEFCTKAFLLGGNQKLPYEFGEQGLKVRYQYDIEKRRFFEEWGWACAISLPYQKFWSTTDKMPILVVDHTYESAGWMVAENLQQDYFEWCAGRLSEAFGQYKLIYRQIAENQAWYWDRILWEYKDDQES